MMPFYGIETEALAVGISGAFLFFFAVFCALPAVHKDDGVVVKLVFLVFTLAILATPVAFAGNIHNPTQGQVAMTFALIGALLLGVFCAQVKD